MIEIMTSCPTNWGMSTLDAVKFLQNDMMAEFPLGTIRDN